MPGTNPEVDTVMRRAPIALALVALLVCSAAAETLVLRSTRIFTGDKEVSGALLVTDEGVAILGADATPPAGAREIELGDALVTPGLIDVGTRLGLADDPAARHRDAWRNAADSIGTGKDLIEAARKEVTEEFYCVADRLVAAKVLTEREREWVKPRLDFDILDRRRRKRKPIPTFPEEWKRPPRPDLATLTAKPPEPTPTGPRIR